MTVTRFAPSPNGQLHLGHAYSAIVAHDRALTDKGRFLLRIEDIDGPRSRPELADAFRADLEWLGLEWEEVPAQSSRTAAYQKVAQTVLKEQHGVLYPCTCSRSEITAAATRMGPDGPIYPGICRGKNLGDIHDKAAWRIDMAKAVRIAGPLTWRDEILGIQEATPEIFGDVVILRKESPASYHLAATLDDAQDGISLVTRGADLFQATHIHRLIQALTGLEPPVWHHHDLLLDEGGQKLAKRRNSPSLTDRRLAGEDGLRLADMLRSGNLPAGISLGR